MLRKLDAQGEDLGATEPRHKVPIHIAGDVHQLVYIAKLDNLTLSPGATSRAKDTA